MDISTMTLPQIIWNIFLGIVIIIALFRIAIWFIDSVVGGLFWKIIKYIKNIPNRIFGGVKK